MIFSLGILMGIAIRTGSPLSLNLAEPVWKQLAGMALTPADLTEIDRDYVPGERGALLINFFFLLLIFSYFFDFCSIAFRSSLHSGYGSIRKGFPNFRNALFHSVRIGHRCTFVNEISSRYYRKPPGIRTTSFKLQVSK